MAKLVDWPRKVFLRMRNLSYAWKEEKGPAMQGLMVGRNIAGEGPTNSKSWRLPWPGMLEPENKKAIWSIVRQGEWWENNLDELDSI